jgi:hypothetical protein
MNVNCFEILLIYAVLEAVLDFEVDVLFVDLLGKVNAWLIGKFKKKLFYRIRFWSYPSYFVKYVFSVTVGPHCAKL